MRPLKPQPRLNNTLLVSLISVSVACSARQPPAHLHFITGLPFGLPFQYGFMIAIKCRRVTVYSGIGNKLSPLRSGEQVCTNVVYNTCQLGVSSSATSSELRSRPSRRILGANKLAADKRSKQTFDEV